MTKAQKDNQARFKKVQAEAKKLKAKNPKLAHTEAVKRAWAIILPKSGKKVGAVKKKVAAKNQTSLFDVIKKPIGLYYDYKLIKQFDTVAQANKYQIQKVGEGYNKNLFFTKKFPLTATKKKSAAKKKPATRKAAIKKQTGRTSIAIDRKIQAKPVGKRVSKSGNVYYEARANRSDKGRLLGVKKKPAVSKHKDTQSHNVSIRVMSGTISKDYAMDKYSKELKLIQYIEKVISDNIVNTKNERRDLYKRALKRELTYLKKMLKEHKTHARELKKLI